MNPAYTLEQQPCCYWFTGLSGAGKTTLSHYFDAALRERGYHSVVLDGDDLREGLNKGLGFSREDRAENIRRIAEVARLLTKAGLIVLVSAISPYREDRQAARARVSEDHPFFEVYVNTSLATCMTRDPKGLYQKARDGQIKHLTGVDDPYEPPLTAQLVMMTEETSLEACIEQLVTHYLSLQQPIARRTEQRYA